MKILVSGGCGQIGSRTTEMLLERGDQVLAIDNFATGRRVHLPESHA
ncbi:MAG: NAD-dependent epimerase/dehydratase family protein, partial [Verrucomicrobiota bacterium]|nr:NAD-dependent epimerase/dehydratase family protein [Verrucomicrobiota bacterium]